MSIASHFCTYPYDLKYILYIHFVRVCIHSDLEAGHQDRLFRVPLSPTPHPWRAGIHTHAKFKKNHFQSAAIFYYNS